MTTVAPTNPAHTWAGGDAVKPSRFRPSLARGSQVLAFPYHWQVPAATEKAAYEAILGDQSRRSFEYIAFPWATVIDGLRGDAAAVGPILMALGEAAKALGAADRRVTVAQHIHAMQFIELFKFCGITDVFWPHATHQQHQLSGIQIHPFPLFPAQTPNIDAIDKCPNRARKYLANFIGAFNPSIYLTNVRDVIFKDAGNSDDLLIIKRNAWHFDRAVYEAQIKGKKPDEARVLQERRHAEEYLEAIASSWFTLCPSGSGPNSIRIFESLCLRSVPIILTRDLRLPGPLDLWERACLIEDDSEAGYRRSISRARTLSVPDRMIMLEAGKQLCEIVLPTGYAALMKDAI
jgi:hypothetical protein